MIVSKRVVNHLYNNISLFHLKLEMEKALIKGEYDSEIAILNIEQKKKHDLVEKAKAIEEEIKQLKEKQEVRQNEIRDRVEVATAKVEK